MQGTDPDLGLLLLVNWLLVLIWILIDVRLADMLLETSVVVENGPTLRVDFW